VIAEAVAAWLHHHQVGGRRDRNQERCSCGDADGYQQSFAETCRSAAAEIEIGMRMSVVAIFEISCPSADAANRVGDLLPPVSVIAVESGIIPATRMTVVQAMLR
jgi:hypothetical protein